MQSYDIAIKMTVDKMPVICVYEFFPVIKLYTIYRGNSQAVFRMQATRQFEALRTCIPAI